MMAGRSVQSPSVQQAISVKPPSSHSPSTPSSRSPSGSDTRRLDPRADTARRELERQVQRVVDLSTMTAAGGSTAARPGSPRVGSPRLVDCEESGREGGTLRWGGSPGGGGGGNNSLGDTLRGGVAHGDIRRGDSPTKRSPRGSPGGSRGGGEEKGRGCGENRSFTEQPANPAESKGAESQGARGTQHGEGGGEEDGEGGEGNELSISVQSLRICEAALGGAAHLHDDYFLAYSLDALSDANELAAIIRSARIVAPEAEAGEMEDAGDAVRGGVVQWQCPPWIVTMALFGDDSNPIPRVRGRGSSAAAVAAAAAAAAKGGPAAKGGALGATGAAEERTMILAGHLAHTFSLKGTTDELAARCEVNWRRGGLAMCVCVCVCVTSVVTSVADCVCVCVCVCVWYV